jgi:hypothetical protein
VLHLTLSAPTLAYDLGRPSELIYALPSASVLVAAGVAAVTGPLAALGSRADRVPGWSIALTAIALSIVTPAIVVAGNEASRDRGRGIDAAQSAGAVEVNMRDYLFDPATVLVPSEGGWVHLRNMGERPHDFRVPELGVHVYVPAGRDTYVRLPGGDPVTASLWCGVGDHQVRGMLGTVSRG